MKRLTPLLLALSTGLCAQVRVDAPVRLVAGDTTDRTIDGLAPAAQEDALMRFDAARSGAAHWAIAGGTAAAVTLTMDPPATGYRDGMRVRFLPTLVNGPSITFNVDGLGPVPVLGSEGRPPVVGELVPGRVAEAIYADSIFVMNSRAPEGCPTGFLQANERLCMQEDDGANVSIFTAIQQCANKGAGLCTWGEYIQACTALSGQLIDAFNDWEWIDDTSDHTHTANQAGRYYCAQQRSIGAVDHPTAYARARCCYRIR